MNMVLVLTEHNSQQLKQGSISQPDVMLSSSAAICEIKRGNVHSDAWSTDELYPTSSHN